MDALGISLLSTGIILLVIGLLTCCCCCCCTYKRNGQVFESAPAVVQVATISTVTTSPTVPQQPYPQGGSYNDPAWLIPTAPSPDVHGTSYGAGSNPPPYGFSQPSYPHGGMYNNPKW